jgi:hypothetical protein
MMRKDAKISSRLDYVSRTRMVGARSREQYIDSNSAGGTSITQTRRKNALPPSVFANELAGRVPQRPQHIDGDPAPRPRSRYGVRVRQLPTEPRQLASNGGGLSWTSRVLFGTSHAPATRPRSRRMAWSFA